MRFARDAETDAPMATPLKMHDFAMREIIFSLSSKGGFCAVSF